MIVDLCIIIPQTNELIFDEYMIIINYYHGLLSNDKRQKKFVKS